MWGGKMIFAIVLLYVPTVIEAVASPRFYENNSLIEYRVFDGDLYESILDSETCSRHRQNMQGFEFFDSSFRTPQGLTKMNMYSLGDFQQCLEIHQELAVNDHVEGKYCVFSLPINLASYAGMVTLPRMEESGNVTLSEMNAQDLPIESMLQMYRIRQMLSLTPTRNETDQEEESAAGTVLPLEFGICIPQTCSLQEVLALLDLLNIQYEQLYCRVNNDKPWVAVDYVAIVIFSLIGFLTCLSTTYDVYYTIVRAKDGIKTNPLLKSFSIYTNSTRLFNLGNTNALDCLDGIRSISVFWVMIGHTFVSLFSMRPANILDIVDYSRDLSSLWVMSANNSVDTFLTVAGLLLVYTSAKKMKPNQLLKNLPLFYLGRYLRMFPLLATAVLLQASLFNRISDGANWDQAGLQVMYCRQYWWSALLHVQNIVNSLEICLPHTWYLSVDFQLYLLSPLFLYWLLRGRRTAWISIIVTTIIVNGVTIYYVFSNDFMSLMWQFVFRGQEELNRYTLYLYNNTISRVSPFAIGMSFGYLLHVTRGERVRLSKWVVFTGYVLASVLFVTCIYMANVALQPDVSTQIMDNLLNIFLKPAWAFSLCWFIYACVNGYGGPINWFLSLRVWKFIARISYSMYMFHYPIQFIKAGAFNTPFTFTLANIFNGFTSDVTYTLVVSVAMCILIDGPSSTLIKYALEGAPKKPRAPKKEELKEKTPDYKEIQPEFKVKTPEYVEREPELKAGPSRSAGDEIVFKL